MQTAYNNKIYELEKLSKDKINYYVLKSKVGNKKAKETLFLNFLPLIKKYAGKILDCKEDFIQNFAVNFLDAVNAFSFKRKIPFAGYIKNIIRANFTSLIRKYNKFSEKHAFCSAETWEVIENTTPDKVDSAAENKEVIIELLQKLTIREQEILVYLYILDAAPKDVAVYLGISYKTVLNTKLRAIEKIRKEVKK